ncbi:unnamed protein product, partial [Didymodactylos carnosus]
MLVITIWVLEVIQEFTDIVKTVYKGARKGSGPVVFMNDDLRKTNAYHLFVNNFCSSCPLGEHCAPLITIINQHKSRCLDEATISPFHHCFLCLGILHEYTEKNFMHQIKKVAEESTTDFETFRCNLSLPLILLVRHAYLLKFLQQVSSDYSDKDIPWVKDQWKNIMVEQLEDIIDKPYQMESPFELNLDFSYDKEKEEFNFLRRFRYADDIKKQKSNAQEGFTRTSVLNVLQDITFDDFEKYYKPNVNGKCICKITAQHEPIYLAGRYNKYSRTLSQTPWIIDGIKKSDTSIEELISIPLKKFVDAKRKSNNSFKFTLTSVLFIYFLFTEHSFLSSGREDVDVRTLGQGRPFVIEFRNPKRVLIKPSDIRKLQLKINESTKDIRVRDLQQISKVDSSQIKEGEEDKTKCYLALCYSDTKIDQNELDILSTLNNLTIEQKTPIRVLHRRTVMTRVRIIHTMSAKLIDDYHFQLNLTTGAGTYIKEFVHGDFGRTEPNLQLILKRFVDILELDVLSVNVDFPPSLGEDDDIQEQQHR